MATDPKVGYQVTATVTSIQGHCAAGHQVGEVFELSCHNPAGLCGFCYHHLFPNLSTFQFGGSYPWWQGRDTLEMQCPDSYNLLKLKLERKPRAAA